MSLHSPTLLELGQIYKQINAPFGSLAQYTLTVSTYAIKSKSEEDEIYRNLEKRMGSWTAQRDRLAAQMKQLLADAQFNNMAINDRHAEQLIDSGLALLEEARACASHPLDCAD